MNILVTGGAGFIGRHLCKFLLEKGDKVICVDNLFTGRRENIAEFEDNPNFEFRHHDTAFPFYIDGIDQIYNLACPASPVHYQMNPVKTIKMGTVAMVNMLGLAKRIGARILQASTSEVYGDPKVHPQPESYWGHVNPIGPRSCYDEGKRVAESLMFAYYFQSEVDIRVARIFNTYGPYMTQNDGRVVSNFIIQALKGEDITIYGDGSQTRSFCFVSEMVEGLYKLMNGNHIGPINLGNPSEFTILQLAELVKKFTDSKSEIVFKELPEDDPTQRQPDITLAKKELGWEPKIPLEKGLEETISYFSKLIKNSSE